MDGLYGWRWQYTRGHAGVEAARAGRRGHQIIAFDLRDQPLQAAHECSLAERAVHLPGTFPPVLRAELPEVREGDHLRQVARLTSRFVYPSRARHASRGVCTTTPSCT